MSHIDDLQRLLDTDLAMEFLLRQCVKPPLSSTHPASCHIILLGIGIHLCQSTQSCINLTDKISLYSDDLQRGFSKHTQNAHYDILHCAMLCDAVRCCAMLCDAVRCCAFVPWERKTWEQVGRMKGIYIAAIVGDEGESANSHVRLVDPCQDRPIALFFDAGATCSRCWCEWDQNRIDIHACIYIYIYI